jgi:hypothetical protein
MMTDEKFIQLWFILFQGSCSLNSSRSIKQVNLNYFPNGYRLIFPVASSDFLFICFPLADNRTQTRPVIFSSRITNHRSDPRKGHHDSESFLNGGLLREIPKINSFPRGVN